MNSNHSSQSNKRKLNEGEKQIRFYSSTNHHKKRAQQQEVSKAQSWKYITSTALSNNSDSV